MCPITAEQAWEATDPSKTDEEREASAAAMMAGVAANDAYLASRSELEQIVALSKGQQVASHEQINSSEAQDAVAAGGGAGEIPTSVTATQTVPGTVVPGSESTEPEATPADTGNDQSGGNNELETLRKQLLDLGVTPSA